MPDNVACTGKDKGTLFLSKSQNEIGEKLLEQRLVNGLGQAIDDCFRSRIPWEYMR